MPPKHASRKTNDLHNPPMSNVVADAIIQGFQNLANLTAGANRIPLNRNQNQNQGQNDGVRMGDVEKFNKLVPAFKGEPDLEKAEAWMNQNEKNVKDQKEEEFLKLVQNDMTVAQYEAKFTSLSRYAPHQVDIENHKARRFEKGLRRGIKNMCLALMLSTFAKVVKRAEILEVDYEKFQKRHKRGHAETSNKSKGGGLNKKKSTLQDGMRSTRRVLEICPHLVDIENCKARRFEKGIRRGIKNGLLAQMLSTFAKVVERVEILEVDYEEFQKGIREAVHKLQTRVRVVVRIRRNQLYKKACDQLEGFYRFGIATARIIGINHAIVLTNSCFNCGKVGHYAMESKYDMARLIY
ncbi:hypothetical protein RJ639_030835 [Escallonia herrerae]|uniref:Retrotransposon gag domain-containing protein n=1 Tax=Escallonia herrerae TaxID=1293975 RepID=A0AA88X416_9ASTE|nr:hypothetical protein RJ639_030835 [Escallonia herrerae]